MPVYDYECQVCKTIQEKQHKIKELQTENCEKCDAPPENLKKLITWGRVPFKQNWSAWNDLNRVG